MSPGKRFVGMVLSGRWSKPRRQRFVFLRADGSTVSMTPRQMRLARWWQAKFPPEIIELIGGHLVVE